MQFNNLYDISEQVVKIATKKNITISTAESFTGGNIAKSITDIPGSSNVLIAGIVAYTIRAKVSILDINKRIIDKYGVVSKEVVNEMSLKSILKTGSDISISTTGFAGPNDGDKNGFVFIGISYQTKSGIKSLYKNFKIKGSRLDVRNFATIIALNKIYKLINGGF